MADLSRLVRHNHTRTRPTLGRNGHEATKCTPPESNSLFPKIMKPCFAPGLPRRAYTYRELLLCTQQPPRSETN
jgi:hypothetical protein